jgi:CRISPR system Cascade subunit CasE
MTVWLTQISPDFRNPAPHRDLRDAVRMHQRVMSLVPDGLGDQPRRQAGVLYRIEQAPGGTRVLVQTGLRPDLARLPADYGNAQVRDLSPLFRWLREGATIRYRLAANTCLRRSHSKTVIPLRGTDAEEWWIRRAPDCGLELDSLISQAPGDVVGSGKQNNPVRYALTQFDGVAVITSADALASAIISGIGRGKSYGCGLLSIAPSGDAA